MQGLSNVLRDLSRGLLHLQTLDDNGRTSSAAVADAGDAKLALLEQVDERDDDARAGRAERVSETACVDEWQNFMSESPVQYDENAQSTHATAPPLTLSFSDGMLRMAWLANATAEKASLSSNLAIWSIDKPAFCNAWGIASAGAMPKCVGSRAASAKAAKGQCDVRKPLVGVMIETEALRDSQTMRASGLRPSSETFCSEARMRALAPSFKLLALS